VFTVKLSATGGAAPLRDEVAIGVPLSSKLTVPLSADPTAAVVSCPVMLNGIPDETVAGPLLKIDKDGVP
jgi:hypothetical protein